jgi:hypothetical protein
MKDAGSVVQRTTPLLLALASHVDRWTHRTKKQCNGRPKKIWKSKQNFKGEAKASVSERVLRFGGTCCYFKVISASSPFFSLVRNVLIFSHGRPSLKLFTTQYMHLSKLFRW